MKAASSWKKVLLAGCPMVFVFSGANCIPDNLFAETAGQIINGLIITTVNTALTNTGVTI